MLKHVLTLAILLFIYVKNTNGATCSTYSDQTTCNGDSRCGWSAASSLCTCADAVDQYIQFIMDSSGSVGGSGWTKEKNFVNEMITNSISTGSIVGVISYSSGAQYVWHFTWSQVRSQITNAVSALPHKNSVTNTRTAISYGLTMFDNQATITTMPRLMMLITDGVPVPDPNQHPCKTNGGPDMEPMLIARDIILVIVGVGTSWNPDNLLCLLDNPQSRGEIVTVDSFNNLNSILSKLEVYTCPIDIDFEITEMKWERSSSHSNQLFIELVNTGDQIPFVSSTSEFSFAGSLSGTFVPDGTWEPSTFMIIYANDVTGNIICKDCDCVTSYGFSNSAGAKHNGGGFCGTNGCCNGGHFYVPVSTSSTSTNGVRWVGATNTNFDLAITLSAANGGTTVVDVAYDASFPSVSTDYTFEKQSLYAAEGTGSNWAASCWQDGTPTDDPLSSCSRPCGQGDSCDSNGDTNAVYVDDTIKCQCSNYASTPSQVPSYYQTDSKCSCIQILNPSNCIGSAIDVGNGQYDVILSWSASATSNVRYYIDYSQGGTSGLSVSPVFSTTYTFPSVSALSLFSANIFAWRNTTDVRSNSISCTIVTPDPTNADTPSPVASTPTMSCWLTILNQYNLVAVGWTDSVPYVADYRFYQTYNGADGGFDDYQASNVNCGSELSLYSHTGNCFKTAYFTTIADPDLVQAYMSPYVRDSGGSLRADIMLSDRVLCDVRTLTPTTSPSAGPLGGPTSSPQVLPTSAPSPQPTIDQYGILACNVRMTPGRTDNLEVSWTPVLANGHDTYLVYGATVSLRWIFDTDVTTPNPIDFNDPKPPVDFPVSGLGGSDPSTVTYYMWADFLPYPGASSSIQSNSVTCNFVSESPTKFPTPSPTGHPSSTPSKFPSGTPTGNPIPAPTQSPTFAPIQIDTCIITLDGQPTGDHDTFKISFNQPTFSYPSTPVAGDVNYRIEWYDPTGTKAATLQYHESYTGISSTVSYVRFVNGPEGGVDLSNGLNIEYDWTATVTIYYNGMAMGNTITCDIATPAPVVGGIPPTFAPVHPQPIVYLDLAPDSKGWRKFFCEMIANEDGEYCTDPSIGNSYCTPICEITEKKNAASDVPVARYPQDFPLDIEYSWAVYCCDYDNDASCRLSTDSCTETARRRRLSTLADGATPSPTIDGYEAYVTNADFAEEESSGTGTFLGYAEGDGTDDIEIFLEKDEDPYNPEWMYIVITGCTVTDPLNGDPITYACGLPADGNPEQPGKAKFGAFDNGTGSFTKKEEGDLPNWLWYVIAGGILFLGVLGWIGYRYYQKRKLNEELLEQRKQEHGGLDDEGVHEFGQLGEDVQFNPLATGGTTDIATGGQFVDKQLNQQKQGNDIVREPVAQEVFRQDFGQVKPNQHHF